MKRILPLLVAIIFLSPPIAAISEEENAKAKEPENVLYIFAHQDDEVPILAKMALDVRNGRDVLVIWITDGALSGDPLVREKESRSVMEMIGVPRENLRFLGYPDQGSLKRLDAELEDILKTTAQTPYTEVTSNAYEGGNIDHDAASLMGALTAKKLEPAPVHYEFPLYNAYKNDYRMGKFIPNDETETLFTKLDKDLAELKLRSLDMYPSQAEIIRMLKIFVNKKSLLKHGEPYRVSPSHDYRKPPTDGTLGYELNARNPASFEDWEKAVVPFLNRIEEAERARGK